MKRQSLYSRSASSLTNGEIPIRGAGQLAPVKLKNVGTAPGLDSSSCGKVIFVDQTAEYGGVALADRGNEQTGSGDLVPIIGVHRVPFPP